MNRVNECHTYRILIERRNGTEILLVADRHGFSLPTIEVPRWERLAPCVISALKEIWNMEAYCLFSPVSIQPGRYTLDFKYQLVELLHPNCKPPIGWYWTPIQSLSENMFANPHEFQTIQSAMYELASYAARSKLGFFGKPRWLQQVLEWVEQRINPLGLRLTGQFQQLNSSPTFSLIRLETNGAALWFKAVGEPNLSEYSITIELTKRFSDYLPEIIATRPEWNAWLTKEAPGSHPGESSSLRGWKAVATALADLQVMSFGQTLHLAHAGCRDLRICTLVGLVQPFLEVMATLMKRQSKASPTPLSPSQLLTLGAQLHDAFAIVESSQLPNTLGHLDFNPGNILVHKRHCIFLDWAEAFVGHPFLTFQYLLEYLQNLRFADAVFKKKLISTYLCQWRVLFDQRAIAGQLAVAPLLAAFAYGAAGDTWRDSVLLNAPDTARHFRSLTRRMKREAELLFNRHRCRRARFGRQLGSAAIERLMPCGL